MTIVATNLGNTREAARQLRFEPVGAITQTNIQKAVEQLITLPQTIVPTPVTGATYAVLAGDTLLEVNRAGAVTINLPTAASRSGAPLTIKDISGAASTNNISIVPNAADTSDIDGLDPLVIASDYGAFTIYPRTLAWGIM